MNMKEQETFKRCRKCGRMIGIIQARAYRSIIVDAETQFVHEDPDGEIYIRIDGTKMRGKQADDYNDDRITCEAVWRPHHCDEV